MVKAIFSIDPGATSGYAIVTIEASPKLLCYGSLKLSGPETSTIRSMEDTLSIFGQSDQIDKVVIENQFVAKNVQSAMKICRKAGRWEEAAYYHGYKVEFIYPSSWQSKELPGTTRAVLKIASIAKCKGIWGVDLKEDMADAALIGRFAALRSFFIPEQ